MKRPATNTPPFTKRNIAAPPLRAALRLFAVTLALAASADAISLASLRINNRAAQPAASANLPFSQDDANRARALANELCRKHTPRDGGTVQGLQAAEWIAHKLLASNIDADMHYFRDATPEGEKTFCNVTCSIPAANSPERCAWVVLISHFDTKPGIGRGFTGANDGASTTALMLTIAEKLAASPLENFNVLCLWTDGEECRRKYAPHDGFHGARHAVHALNLLDMPVAAAIGLDMLGDADLHIEIPSNGTPHLKNLAVAAARKIGEPNLLTLASERVRDDFSIFLDAGIPAIDLIDFDYGPDNSWWHTPADTMAHVSANSLFRAGNLVLAILAQL
ncbi:MAG: M28 family peptidase [Kiritimatiellae bacterium]|nr:M28 family peptidase [Kiritimatiellia bacterium]